MAHQHDNNYFSYAQGRPFHLSVGAVLMNDKGEICVHHYQNELGPDLKNIYLLMRETIHPDETIETALARGLQEEFGVQAKMEDFLGSLMSKALPDYRDPNHHREFEKTTLYFLCQLISQDTSQRDQADFEGKSRLEWLKPDELLKKFHDQAKRHPHRTDIDESEIIKRAIASPAA